MKKLVLLATLVLMSCNTPKIQDPRVEYPLPPASLMEPTQNLQTIEVPQDNGKPKI